ncbi:MAG: 4a-hydroxytetrahydrobiopterin dehydratase [Ignavibacteria bacterium]|nr:4a-hydroxytetrahydrobiopterin dehydratase [Ignavibacteria bacterium]
MTKLTKLTKDQIDKDLKKLKGWKTDYSSIKKTYKTKGFPQTMGLVTAIGALCQQHDHHPDYMTLKYAEVEVSFSTHSVKGISHKDFDIAKDIETLKF